MLGIGVRILSVEPIYLPKIKNVISNLGLQEAKELADKLLKQPKVRSIANILFKDNKEKTIKK